jgi:hypothetical protein
MPRGDGTGPMGLGPRTGRGRGMCSAWSRIGGIGRVHRRRGGGLLWGLAVPVAAAAVGELLNPRGRLRQVMRALLPGKSAPPPRRLDDGFAPLRIEHRPGGRKREV